MIRTLACLALLLPATALAADRPLAIPADSAPPAPPSRGEQVKHAEPLRIYGYSERPYRAPTPPEQPARQALHRAQTWALGLRWGSLHSGFSDGYIYGDAGFGGTVRYRPIGGLGLQADLHRHTRRPHEGGSRAQTLASASVGLFAWHRHPVSPYALAGMTWTSRNLHHNLGDASEPDWVRAHLPLSGLHVGAGLEIAIGRRLALDLEARHIGYISQPPGDPARPGALSTTASFLVHF